MSFLSNTAWAIITVGLILNLMTINVKTDSALTGTIIGYSFIASGLCIIGGILMTSIVNPAKISPPDAIKTPTLLLLTNIGPLLMMFGLIVILLQLFSKHRDSITNGHVTPDFVYFLWLMYVLVLVFFLILYFEARNKITNPQGLSLSKNMLLLLISLIAAIDIKTITVMLRSFKTDG